MSGGVTSLPPSVSVVITAHNEAAGIGATLRALACQTLPPGAHEVVLIDDRSTDGTAEAARAAGHPALVIHPAAPDPASPLTTRQQALDRGFALARGAIVLTLDGDCLVPPGWLAAMTAPIRAGMADAVAGPIGFAPVRGAVALWQNADAAYYFAVSALLARAGFAPGAFFGNFAFRRELYAATGGFAAIGPALTEDLAFAQALHRAGARFAFARVRADVAPCPDAAALLRRTMRIARGPVSALAVALAAIPLTLVAPALAAVILASPALGLVALVRWALGAGFVAAALWRHGARVALPGAAVYEPGAVLVALAVLAARLGGTRIDWGGRQYG
jgi:cellulose synthase/poly-beta-1,6-N-acetylglucosamine synthase-like glycosyltransferase